VLGFALAGSSQVSALASVASLGSFLVGAACSAWAARRFDGAARRSSVWTSALEACLLGLAALTTVLPELPAHAELTVSILGLAMGVRTARVQRIQSGLSTTVVTSTLASLAGDLAGGGRAGWPAARPRLAAVVALLLGVVAGAVMLQHGATVVLALAAVLTLAVAVLGAGPEPGADGRSGRPSSSAWDHAGVPLGHGQPWCREDPCSTRAAQAPRRSRGRH
jgi:uncharacterized membrane protein YoaK (UPF0700 family)